MCYYLSMKEQSSHTPSHAEEYTSEQKRERIKQAGRILEDWLYVINSTKTDMCRKRPNDLLNHSAVMLADKIIATATNKHPDDVSELKTHDMHLSTRLSNALIRAGIYKVGDLNHYSYQELLEKPKIGKIHIAELKRRLGELGITLPDKK